MSKEEEHDQPVSNFEQIPHQNLRYLRESALFGRRERRETMNPGTGTFDKVGFRNAGGMNQIYL